jgi:enediyne biosynthesis protein E3
MKHQFNRIARAGNRWLSISLIEVTFEKRGFQCTDAKKREHLEGIGASFVHGYNLGLKIENVDDLCVALNKVKREERGFSYEGAAMSLALTDHLWRPRHSRWRQLYEGGGFNHKYMLYVGYGWAIARLPWLKLTPHTVVAQHTCIERWLIYDGYGFHEGYFNPARTVHRTLRPERLTGLAGRAFDQGLGRSLWFVYCANPCNIASAVNHFAPERRADLWSGVALAAAYAGGVTRAELRTLLGQASGYEEQVAQGAAFAIEARRCAGLQTEHTELAAQELCGCSSEEAGAATQYVLNTLKPEQNSHEAYEAWRAGIRQHFRLAWQPVAKFAEAQH